MSEPDRTGDPGEGIRRNVFFALALQLTTSVFTAALTVFLVRALEPAGYGIFALASATATLLVLPFDLGISQSAARFIAERRGDRGGVAAVLSDAVKLKLVASGFACLGLFVAAGWIAAVYGEPGLRWPLRGFALALFAQTFYLLFQHAFVAQARIAVSFRVGAAESVAESIFSILLVLLGAGATGAAFGRAAGYAVGAAGGLAMTLRLLGRTVLRSRFARGRARRMMGYAGALAIVDGAWTLFGQVDAVLIGALLTSASVGLYAAPMKLIVLTFYPGNAIASAVAPRLARHERHEPNVAAFVAALRFVVIFQAAIVTFLLVWAKPLIDLVLGPEYEQSAELLRALTPVAFLGGISPLVAVGVNYLGEARRRIPIAFFIVLLNVILDLALLPTVGLIGVAIASGACFAVYVPAHFWVFNRLIELPLAAIARTLVRSFAAAAVLAAVLVAAGTDELSPARWIGGICGGLTAYAVALLFLREVSLAELRAAGRAVLGAVRRPR